MNLLRAEKLIARPLHPRIEAKARIQFAIGAYGSAVLDAFRELEVRVRAAGGFAASVLGDNLMRQAFNPETGPLTDTSLVNGERRAIMELYAGAMGAFKNPLSHRTVDYDDPIIAAEQLLFADLLHRMLDGFEDRRDSTA
ncbi:MAG TPA: TIGR02391 family protein [Thermomicrobiales bacterium]|nr:TIGR02391 family protein [Thermomicrobiales bacterium]